MYYDSTNKYLIVKLKETYYHYCGISSNVVSNWISHVIVMKVNDCFKEYGTLHKSKILICFF